MKIIYIKGLHVNPEITSPTNEITSLLFDPNKYLGKMQDFINALAFYEFDGIVLPVDLDTSTNHLGLEICIRIRLSKNLLGQKANCTFFLFHSQSPVEIFKEQIQNDANPTASILYTEGTFSFDDAASIKFLIENPKNYNILNESNFKKCFFDNIQIKKSPNFGNHSIANIWGANRLADVTGNTELLQSFVSQSDNLKEKKSDLYFMYLTSVGVTKPITTQKHISAVGKNILLIDDEADKGWEVVLKTIFKGGNFESITPSANLINEAQLKLKETINNLPKWDLVLLDLRLVESEDQGENAYKTASKYTGAAILKEIKENNFGTQVIMFTASNKAWNMRELLNLGADGFYIKESPEYGYDLDFSQNNYAQFEVQVNTCFKKGFLRSLFSKLSPLKDLCTKESIKKPNQKTLKISPTLVETAIDQFFIFSKLLGDFPDELKWSYNPLALLIEEIVHEYYYQDGIDQVVSVNLLSKQKCIYEKGSERYLALTPVNNGRQYSLAEYKLNTEEEKAKYKKQIKFAPFNYKLTCVLHFKYSLPLDNSIFKYFEVYRKRSESVMHASSVPISAADVNLALELLSELIR